MADDNCNNGGGPGSSADGCKGYGNTAVGYWGGDIYKRIMAEQTMARQRTNLIEQIMAGGIRFHMWRGVEEGEKCSCYKESNQRADAKCGSCYGVGLVPGYTKFGYETLWMSSVDTDVVFTNTEVMTDFKTAKIGLTSGSLTGTVESGDKPFSRSVLGSFWESDNLSFVRIDGQSTVTTEYSLDSGGTWSDISNLATVNPTSGNIRFRATLTRTSANVLTPLFEIVRARYATIGLSAPLNTGAGTNPDCHRLGPWVLLMRSMPIHRKLKNEHADLDMQDNTKMWTTGLSYFDPSIEVGSNDEAIDSNKTLFEIMDGVRVGSRYKVTTWQPSDPFAYVIVQQTMDLRYLDPFGPHSLVW